MLPSVGSCFTRCFPSKFVSSPSSSSLAPVEFEESGEEATSGVLHRDISVNLRDSQKRREIEQQSREHDSQGGVDEEEEEEIIDGQRIVEGSASDQLPSLRSCGR